MQVRAAGLRPAVKALASGAHYGSADQLPKVAGVDGVGLLDNGAGVYFVTARPPYGTCRWVTSPLLKPSCSGLSSVKTAWWPQRPRTRLERGTGNERLASALSWLIGGIGSR